jgi:hypothetical protein
MKKPKKAFTLSEIYEEVSQLTETKGTKINAAETRRVISAYHIVLANLDSDQAFQIVGKGIANARKSALFDYLKKKLAKRR